MHHMTQMRLPAMTAALDCLTQNLQLLWALLLLLLRLLLPPLQQRASLKVQKHL